MEALPFPHPPESNVVMFLNGVIRTSLARHVKVRFDVVFHISKNKGRTLDSIIICILEEECLFSMECAFNSSKGYFPKHLIPSDIVKPDRFHHMNPIDHPGYCRLPVYRFKNSPGCRGSHYIVAYPLYLHFRTGEARIIPPHFQFDTKSDILHLLTRSITIHLFQFLCYLSNRFHLSNSHGT